MWGGVGMVWSGVWDGEGGVGWVRGGEAHENDTLLLVAVNPLCLAKHCG